MNISEHDIKHLCVAIQCVLAGGILGFVWGKAIHPLEWDKKEPIEIDKEINEQNIY